MKNVIAKPMILVVLIVVIIIAASSSFAFAYWGGNPTQSISGSNSGSIEASDDYTYKYLVFRANGLDSGEYYFRYSDEFGLFVANDFFGDGLAEVTANSVSTVSAISYLGALGEYEKLIIPSSINAKIAGVTKILGVTIIDMQSPVASSSLDLITSVEIPSSIVSIENASFSGCGNLRSVYFNSVTLPTISSYSFIGLSDCNYYKLNGEVYELTSIVRL